MRRFLSALALVIGLAGAVELSAQQPPLPPILQTGGTRHPAKPECATCSTKVCVTEMKAATKVVHGTVTKDYCYQGSAVADFFRSCLGHKCRECECGTPKTYSVLTKKVVPGTATPVCKVKDLSAPLVPVDGKKAP